MESAHGHSHTRQLRFLFREFAGALIGSQQISAFHQLQDQVVRLLLNADTKQPDNVWMLEISEEEKYTGVCAILRGLFRLPDKSYFVKYVA